MNEYKCSKCGRNGCKLWRDYSPIGRASPLLCCDCAAKDQGKDVSTIDAQGRRLSGGARSDQIGWYVPAVPLVPDKPGEYWAYSSVPPDRAAWWRSLPTRPLEIVK